MYRAPVDLGEGSSFIADEDADMAAMDLEVRPIAYIKVTDF